MNNDVNYFVGFKTSSVIKITINNSFIVSNSFVPSSYIYLVSTYIVLTPTLHICNIYYLIYVAFVFERFFSEHAKLTIEKSNAFYNGVSFGPCQVGAADATPYRQHCKHRRRRNYNLSPTNRSSPVVRARLLTTLLARASATVIIAIRDCRAAGSIPSNSVACVCVVLSREAAVPIYLPVVVVVVVTHKIIFLSFHNQ
ncbi:hypothetical protein AGLY_013527 [Aphis glycines]|uniref:Uncharacterized protein n=1 Tax=Aphis glycines TaxID=307491 RepID=A0A6G0T8N6_APHGL|nr:hypothetical protein AGLY_013527 [Aphis glycines]